MIRTLLPPYPVVNCRHHPEMGWSYLVATHRDVTSALPVPRQEFQHCNDGYPLQLTHRIGTTVGSFSFVVCDMRSMAADWCDCNFVSGPELSKNPRRTRDPKASQKSSEITLLVRDCKGRGVLPVAVIFVHSEFFFGDLASDNRVVENVFFYFVVQGRPMDVQGPKSCHVFSAFILRFLKCWRQHEVQAATSCFGPNGHSNANPLGTQRLGLHMKSWPHLAAVRSRENYSYSW